MSNADSYVRARIDNETKKRATKALDAMGLSVSEAIRLLLVRVASEQRLPFEVRVPNETTLEAMNEISSEAGDTFDSVEDLMADLNAED